MYASPPSVKLTVYASKNIDLHCTKIARAAELAEDSVLPDVYPTGLHAFLLLTQALLYCVPTNLSIDSRVCVLSMDAAPIVMLL